MNRNAFQALAIGRRLLLPLFIVGVVATAVAGYSLFAAYRQPAEMEKFVPEYSYKNNAQLDYVVHLKPNSLFGETTLGSGQNYFSKVVKGIDLLFSYNFAGEPASEVRGTYEIRAILVSGDLSAELEEGKTKGTKLWEKSSALVPETPFTGQGGSVSIKETIPLHLQEFESEARAISEELGIGSRQHYVKILGLVKTSARLPSSREVVAKEPVATLVVPLGQSYFTLTGKQASAQDSIGKTERVVLIDVVERREGSVRSTLISGGITGILGILMLCRFALKPARKTQPVSAVPRRYRERVAEANGQANHLAGDIVSLLSFKDLVKVADEAGKPIVHQAFVDGDVREAFYVCDGSIRYAYLVREGKEVPNEAGR